MVYIEHSYTADLSCCPEELIYSEIYWAELPRFVMTDSRGEKECGGKQNSALRLQNTKNKTYELSEMFHLLLPRPGERTRDSPPTPPVHYNPVPGQLIGQHSIKEQK